MRKFIVVLFVLILSACQPKAEEDPNDQQDKIKVLEKESLLSDYIQWYGRTLYEDDEVHFYYTATGFKIHFTGSAVIITLGLSAKQDDIYFSLAKDGESLLDSSVLILDKTTQSFTITFEEYGVHEIELVKRSEPEDGVTSLLSIETNGEFHPVEQTEAPHFLIIGGSGISGHGALGEPWEDRSTSNSSSLHSFGYLTAIRFQGSFEFVSSSGWGLAFGYNDRTGETNIQDAYESVGINSYRQIIDVPYNHQVIPDVIIVNIGGNDYTSVINQLTGFDKENKIQEFKTAVATFILKLRADAPEAHIFWTMTSGSINGTAAESVINLLSEEDKQFVHLVVIKSIGADGTPVGANGHASYETHLLSAQILIDQILEYTNLLLQE